MQRTSPAARAALERRLAEYLQRPPPGRQYDAQLQSMCAEHGVLELLREIGGAHCLSPCGRAVAFSHSEAWPTTPQPLVSALWQRAAARHAARRYPELELLLPRRLAGDVECSECAGEGMSARLGSSVRARCEACNGIGWIWPEVQDSVACPYCAFDRDDEPPVTEQLERCFCGGARRIERARVARGFELPGC